jgi:hypothetical protein
MVRLADHVARFGRSSTPAGLADQPDQAIRFDRDLVADRYPMLKPPYRGSRRLERIEDRAALEELSSRISTRRSSSGVSSSRRSGSLRSSSAVDRSTTRASIAVPAAGG